jgi:trehalose 6-phosphate phosphatase
MVSLPPPPHDLLDGAALFLDFDGTLVELAETPGAIRVEPALSGRLERLRARLGGRLGLISGRSLADLDRYLDCAGLFVSGSHGVEIRPAGAPPLALSIPPGLVSVRSAAARFAAGTNGLIVEDKPAGIALHYRRAPDEGDRVLAFMTELGREHDMAVQSGSMVVELRPKGSDKGDALRAFMTEPAFAGARPVFVGDDLTDEHGFAAAAELGGAGVLVGPERRTSARYRLGSVAAVADWLDRAAQ